MIEKISHKYFQSFLTTFSLKSDLNDEVIKALGRDPDKPETWGFYDIIYDYYDESVEIIGIQDLSWLPDLSGLWELGFSCCWFIYMDKTERYGYKSHTKLGDATKTFRKV